MGMLAGALISYLLNRRFVFRSQLSHRHGLPKFLLVALGGGIANFLIMRFGTEQLMMPYLPLQLFATCSVLPLTFNLNRLWTFSLREIE